MCHIGLSETIEDNKDEILLISSFPQLPPKVKQLSRDRIICSYSDWEETMEYDFERSSIDPKIIPKINIGSTYKKEFNKKKEFR